MSKPLRCFALCHAPATVAKRLHVTCPVLASGMSLLTFLHTNARVFSKISMASVNPNPIVAGQDEE